MKDIESIISQLCEKTNKDRYEIKKLIEDKQVKFKHQISDLAAAKILAKELNVELTQVRKKAIDIAEILHLPPGTADISVKGTVSRVYSILEFNKTQGVGKVQHFNLIDNSGEIKVVAWDRMVDLLSKIRLSFGDKIQIYKGIVRMGKTGEREIHLNDLSTIQPYVDTDQTHFLPETTNLRKTPDEISIDDKGNELNLTGIVYSIGEVKSFQKDDRESQLLPITMCGEKELIRVVAWGEKVHELKNIEIGDELLIQGIKVKVNRNNIPEAHINRRSLIEKLSKDNPLPSGIDDPQSEFLTNRSFSTSEVHQDKDQKIELKDLEKTPYSKIIVRITFIEEMRSFTRKDGKVGYIRRLGVFDQTGSDTLVLWDDLANESGNWRTGSILEISNAYLRDNPRGGKEIYVTRSSTITPNDSYKGDDLPSDLPLLQIKDLNTNWKIVRVSGKILDISETREFTRQRNGEIGRVRWLQLADKSGSIRLVAWNDKVVDYDDLEIDALIIVNNVIIRLQETGLELHLSDHSLILSGESIQSILPEWANVSNISVPRFPTNGFVKQEYLRTSLINLPPEQNFIELRARIKDLGQREPYYFACPTCRQKISDEFVESAICQTHGDQKPIIRLRIPIILDDGNGTIFSTLFSPTAEFLTGIREQNLVKRDNFDELTDIIKNKIVGREFIFQGIFKERVVGDPPKKTWNFNIKNVYEPNPIYEIERLYEDFIEEES